MMFLLDQGLPRTTPLHLRRSGQEAVHAGDAGLATADDRTILAHALERGQVIVTLDADFHTYLALSGASGPSTVRVRIEGLKAEQLADLIMGVLRQCKDDLDAGAMVTVTESSIRVRRLPLTR